MSRLAKRVTAASNCNSTVPVGPWRCLPMITSALPSTRSPSASHSANFSRFASDRLAHLVIIFLAEHEQHDVGVLLDRAGFAQVRKLRPLVLAVLDLARQLRQRQDRNVELLGQRLQPRRDFGDLLDAVLAGAAARALQKLHVVDHQQIESALALEPSRARRQLADRKAAGLVDIERQVLQFDRNVLDLLEFGLVDARRGGSWSTVCRSARR